MITKEMLQTSSSMSKYFLKTGKKELKIVLTTEEMETLHNNNKTSVSTIQFNIEGKRYWFYTDDYCNGQGITWGPGKLSYVETAPSSTRIPKQVVPRPGLEDGWIRSIKDFESIYCRDDHQLLLSRSTWKSLTVI